MNNLTLSTSSIHSTNVVNAQGESLGNIKDIMIDTETGRISYAVLSFGGILGLGDKLFALPWPALRFDTNNERVVIDMDKERLENAPGFDKDNWPTEPQTFTNRVYQHYGYEPFYSEKNATADAAY